MSTTTRGEAAYLNGMLTNRGQIPAFEAIIEKERTAERRATVERIREAISHGPRYLQQVLDEEAAR